MKTQLKRIYGTLIDESDTLTLKELVVKNMKPYFQDDAVTIYHGDCWDVLPNLPHVDLVLTDPPYGIPKAAWLRTYHGSRGKSPLWGAVPSWDKVPERVKDIVELADKVVLWGGNNFDLPAAPHWFVWDKLQSNRGADCELAWTKGVAAHKVFRMSRIDAYVNKAGGIKKEHPTQKPLALMVWCIEQMSLSRGATVFDPFMGSGTSLLAARKTGHKAIGVEMEERYCEIAASRMAQGVPGMRRYMPGMRDYMGRNQQRADHRR